MKKIYQMVAMGLALSFTFNTIKIANNISSNTQSTIQTSLNSTSTPEYVCKSIIADEGMTDDYTYTFINGSIDMNPNDCLLMINGRFVPYKAIVKGDSSFVPLRVTAESFGANVAWNNKTNQVTISGTDMKITMSIGNARAIVNGTPQTLSTPPFIHDNRTYVPLRFVSESMGKTVGYVPAFQEENYPSRDLLAYHAVVWVDDPAIINHAGQTQEQVTNWLKDQLHKDVKLLQPEGNNEAYTSSSIDDTTYIGQVGRYAFFKSMNPILVDMANHSVYIVNLQHAGGGVYKEMIPSNIGIIEENITIGKGTDYELSGTLTLPKDVKKPLASVVLVHGSGPNDRDETIYNNKPFKDMADYLAENGIAVLRYDKRTYVYQKQIAQNIAAFTVEEETIDDAILAANILKADARMDKNKVFIIGHSLGGMLAPRIDAEGGNFAGIIMMAGTPRTLSDVICDQYMAIVNTLTGDTKIKGQSQVDALVATFEALKDMSDADAKKITLVGASGYYYKEMEAHPAFSYLKAIQKPVLILQGGKDFQVYPDKDYKEYQTLLSGKTNVAFKLYADLNHLFMLSTTGTAEEYKSASHVDSTVLGDIVAWIQP